MGFTRDLHTRGEVQPDGKLKRVRNARWGSGKRWLSVWHDETGAERSQAFATKEAADRHWQAMETDRERGEYLDPRAGRELVSGAAARWLASRSLDPTTAIRYEALWRLHVEPVFGRRKVKNIRPSHVQAWLAALRGAYGPSTAIGAYAVLAGTLDLAVADKQLRDNPARNPAVSRPRPGARRNVVPWTDAQVGAIIDAHPADLRLLPILMAGCGLRVAEAFALAATDLDMEEEVLHVRRQIKRLGTSHVYALPKNDTERQVPLSGWVGEAARRHMAAFAPRPCTLAWERPGGRPVTHLLLFRGRDGQHMRYQPYSGQTWKPALVRAGIVPPPVVDERYSKRYATTGAEGPHQLRHYYASVMLADGISVADVAAFLGHADPSVTLRTYAHMLPSSRDRARRVMDDRLFRPRAVSD